MRIDHGYDMHLINGELVHLRLFDPTRDGSALRTLYDGLSEQSVYFRWFSAGRTSIDLDVRRMMSVPVADGGPPQRRAIIGERGGVMVGIAGWERLTDHAGAEVAFAVDEHAHGLGLATLLLEELAAEARDVGIRTFTADVLTGNPSMVAVFRDAGFAIRSEIHVGVISLSFSTCSTESIERIASGREAMASRILPVIRP